MDYTEKIPVKDVKQIAYEMALLAVDMEKTKQYQIKLNGSTNINFKEEFDKMIDDRIGIVLKRME
jgi:hypothetical protein